jgi:hypothetical protein
MKDGIEILLKVDAFAETVSCDEDALFDLDEVVDGCLAFLVPAGFAGHRSGAEIGVLVTEPLLPLADYFGNTNGYSADKMNIPIEVTKGAVLNVPILANSPFSFELQVTKSIPLDDSEVFICKIRNVLVNEELTDKDKSIEQRILSVGPIRTTCCTYFSWDGKSLGKWGEPMHTIIKQQK